MLKTLKTLFNRFVTKDGPVWELPRKFSDDLLHEPVVVGIEEDGSDEWLALRRGGIGSSDAAAIIGIPGAFSTPVQIWAEKRGALDDDERRERMEEMLYWGHELEGPISARLFHELDDDDGAPRPLVLEEKATLAHPDHPWMRANIDRWAWTKARGLGVGELKTASIFVREEWEDGAPLKYQVQLQHQLAVTGAKWGVVAVLIGGNRFEHFIMDRNDAFIEVLIEQEAAFWQMVQDNEMPDPTGRDNTILGKLFEEDEELEMVILPPDEFGVWDERRQEANEIIKKAKAEKAEAEAKIKAMIGKAPGGVIPNGAVYTFKTQRREGYTVEPKTFRQLRRKKGE